MPWRRITRGKLDFNNPCRRRMHIDDQPVFKEGDSDDWKIKRTTFFHGLELGDKRTYEMHVDEMKRYYPRVETFLRDRTGTGSTSLSHLQPDLVIP